MKDDVSMTSYGVRSDNLQYLKQIFAFKRAKKGV